MTCHDVHDINDVDDVDNGDARGRHNVRIVFVLLFDICAAIDSRLTFSRKQTSQTNKWSNADCLMFIAIKIYDERYVLEDDSYSVIVITRNILEWLVIEHDDLCVDWNRFLFIFTISLRVGAILTQTKHNAQIKADGFVLFIVIINCCGRENIKSFIWHLRRCLNNLLSSHWKENRHLVDGPMQMNNEWVVCD